jgi:excisionase family DNA binding protein
VRTASSLHHLTQLGGTDRGEVQDKPWPGRVPMIAPPSRLPTAGKPRNSRSSAGSTIQVNLPALVWDWPLALRLVALFRSKTERELEPRRNVATDGNIARERHLRKTKASVLCQSWQQLPEKREEFLTPKQVAYRLGVGVHSVYRAVNRGELPATRLSARGAIRVPASALEPRRR